MSLYAIKDEDGELRDTAWDSPNITREFYAYTGVSVDDATRKAAKHRGSRVVELVEKSEPVEVVEKQRNLLYQLDEALEYDASSKYAGKLFKQLHRDADMSCADIFRALDVGWTVKQPKRWYVKTPKEWDGRGERQRFYKRNDNSIGQAIERFADNSTDEQFTAEEIERYRLGRFEKVEVED
jgi:hypothetical protein